MDKVKEAIGKRLKKLREYLKLSPEEFYGALGLRAEYRHKYESGTVLPKIEKFALLKELYNVNLNWLIAGTGNMFETDKHTEKELTQEEKQIADEIAKFFGFEKEEREIIKERELLNLFVFYALAYLWKFRKVKEIKILAEKLMIKSPAVREEILKDTERFNLPVAIAINVIQFELFVPFYEIGKKLIKEPYGKISYKFAKAVELQFSDTENYCAFVWDFHLYPSVIEITPSREIFLKFAEEVVRGKHKNGEEIKNILIKQILKVYEKYFDVVIPKIEILPDIEPELEEKEGKVLIKTVRLKENVIKFPVIKKEKMLVKILKELEDIKNETE